jgi:hypothetical protein
MKFVPIIFLVAFCLRLLYATYLHSPELHLFSDMANYHQISEAIGRGEWNPYHFFQPIGFPLILLGIKYVFKSWGSWLGLFQALASTLSLWFIWLVIRHELPKRWAIATLAVSALHLPWIIYTGFAFAETFFTLALSIVLYLSWKLTTGPFSIFTSLLWGGTFIIAFLLKGTHIFLAPLSFLLWWWYLRKKAIKNFILPAGLMLAMGLGINGILSYKTIDRFQLSASAGGLNLVEGKCPWKWNEDKNGINWASPIYVQRKQNKIKKQWDVPFYESGHFFRQGVQCIVRDPLVLIHSLEGIPLLFVANNAWPANQIESAYWVWLYEYFFSIFLIVGGVVYFIGLRSYTPEELPKELFIWVLPAFSLFMTVYIFKSEMRFRIPFDVWFIPVALMGWRKLLCTSNTRC